MIRKHQTNTGTSHAGLTLQMCVLYVNHVLEFQLNVGFVVLYIFAQRNGVSFGSEHSVLTIGPGNK